ncbi:MAG: addiction module protein [Verrucomicrobiota bacterium]
MNVADFPEIEKLAPLEKLELAKDLLSQIQGQHEVEVAPEILAALDRRVAYYKDHPDEVSTWEEVRERVFG